jgi:hypothetical protein
MRKSGSPGFGVVYDGDHLKSHPQFCNFGQPRSHLCRTSRTLDVLGRSALGGSGESNFLSCACGQMTRKGTHLCCAQASGTRSVILTDNATILTVQLRKYESGRAERSHPCRFVPGAALTASCPPRGSELRTRPGHRCGHRATPE